MLSAPGASAKAAGICVNTPLCPYFHKYARSLANLHANMFHTNAHLRLIDVLSGLHSKRLRKWKKDARIYSWKLEEIYSEFHQDMFFTKFEHWRTRSGSLTSPLCFLYGQFMSRDSSHDLFSILTRNLNADHCRFFTPFYPI